MKHSFLRFSVILLTVLFSLFTFHSACAQRVAVVLSGGGAKGGAHIGVLRALEEMHVPVSYIAGTSIGAAIGALYASGYSPDEIEALMGSREFQNWASGMVDEKTIFYYRKENPNASWISTNFDFSKKITSLLPTQFIKTYEIDFQLMQMFAGANAMAKGNFDNLMIPFRCVVSDIDSSVQVVLRSGDLSTAVRGSMSLPLIYSPAVINNKLVFDGGMYNNFPSDVAIRDFHPDVVIGSRVATRYDKPDRDDIVSQVLIMLMGRQSDSILFPRSVLIVPRIPVIDLLDFSKTPVLADSGYQAAIRKIAEIKKLVHDTLSDRELSQRREAFRAKRPELRFDSIHITGLNRVQSAYLRKILKHGRKTVSLDDLHHEYFRFIDEGFVKCIVPAARYNPKTGFYDLYLDVQRANNFGTQFGGDFSLANNSEAFLQIQYRYLWTKALTFFANGYFGRVYSSGKIGGRVDFNSKVPWFVDINYTYNHFNFFRNASFFFDDKTPNYILTSENFADLGIGTPVTSSGKLSMRTTWGFFDNKYYQSNTFSRNDTADQTNFRFVAPSVSLDINTLNRKQYASAGIRLMAQLTYVNGHEGMTPGSTAVNKSLISKNHDWFRFRLVYDNYFQSLGPVKLGFYGEGVLSNQPLFSNYTSSLLYAPRFEPVPEAQTYFLPPLRATNYIAAGLKMVLKVYKKIEFRLEGYLFQPYREIMQNPADYTASFGRKFADRSYLASSALVYNGPVGPISIGANYYDKMPDPFTINFNFGYILFNHRAIP